MNMELLTTSTASGLLLRVETKSLLQSSSSKSRTCKPMAHPCPKVAPHIRINAGTMEASASISDACSTMDIFKAAICALMLKLSSVRNQHLWFYDTEIWRTWDFWPATWGAPHNSFSRFFKAKDGQHPQIQRILSISYDDFFERQNPGFQWFLYDLSGFCTSIQNWEWYK